MSMIFGYNYKPLPQNNIHTWAPGRYGSNRGICDKIAGDNHTEPLPPGISIEKRKDGLIRITRDTGHHSVYDPRTGSWDTYTGPSKL